MWQKAGASKLDVLQSMLAGGEVNGLGIDPHASLEQKAERFECMKRAGYRARLQNPLTQHLIDLVRCGWLHLFFVLRKNHLSVPSAITGSMANTGLRAQ